jgi:DNA-binding NarL/FixJ family response regulator
MSNDPDKNPAPPVRTMIVEDQGMIRGFLERWLSSLSGFVLVASARSGEEALEQVAAARPDVVLVDYQLPGMDGLEFIRSARQVRPQLRALVVSSLVDPLALTRIREAGVEGYLEKDAPPDLLTEAVTAVAAGRVYFSQKFRETMARESKDAEAIGKILSRREQQVLGLVVAGKTSREIAGLMALSVRTVEFHRANLTTKLGTKSPAELAVIARLRGWSRDG